MIAVARRLNVSSPPEALLVTDQPVPPMAFGILRGQVLLPRAAVDALTGPQLDVVFAHELAPRRRDAAITTHAIARADRVVVQPAGVAARIGVGRAQEECCDDAVLAEGIAEPGEYCRTILAAAERTAAPPCGAGRAGC